MKSTFPSPTMICQEILVFMHLIKKHTPINVKYKPKEKYEKKVLVWLAVSAKDISKHFICSTKGSAITTDLYIKKCLSKFLSFIKTYH